MNVADLSVPHKDWDSETWYYKVKYVIANSVCLRPKGFSPAMPGAQPIGCAHGEFAG